MKPAARKQAAKYMIENSSLSQRTACRLAGISRSTYAYRARPRNDAMLRARLKKLAARHSSYGYKTLVIRLSVPACSAKEGQAGREQEADLPPLS